MFLIHIVRHDTKWAVKEQLNGEPVTVLLRKEEALLVARALSARYQEAAIIVHDKPISVEWFSREPDISPD